MFEPAVREAVERAMQAAAASPNEAGKAAALGMVLHAHDQYANAVQAYRRARALDPANADTVYYLGAALAADGHYTEALEPLRQAAAAKPEDVAVRLKLADTLLAAGELAAARQHYEALVAKDPSLPGAHYGLGRTLAGDEAVAAYTRALSLFPRYGAAQFALAAAYRRAGRNREAEQALANYERDKTVTPPLPDPAIEKIYALNVSSTGLLRRAQILESHGDVGAALAIHEQLVRANPKLDQAWVNMISLYARLGRSAEAEQAFERAVALTPNRADAYYNFGVFCYSQRRWAQARSAFEKAHALDPRNAEAAHNLGASLERDGQLAQAKLLFQKAILLQPNHRLAHFHLGRIHVHERNYAEAIAEFEKTIEPDDEQSPTFLYALAAACARAGQKQRAYELLGRARAGAVRFGQAELAAAIARDLEALAK